MIAYAYRWSFQQACPDDVSGHEESAARSQRVGPRMGRCNATRQRFIAGPRTGRRSGSETHPETMAVACCGSPNFWECVDRTPSDKGTLNENRKFCQCRRGTRCAAQW